MLELDGVQQTTAAYGNEQRITGGHNAIAQLFAASFGVGHQILVFNHVKSGESRSRTQRIAGKGGAWEPGVNRAASFSPKAIMPPIGNPPATPLAKVTISGVTPPDRSSRWNANHLPVRPIPVCTSSMISSAWLISHSSRTNLT